MEIDELEKRIQWLDSERQKDKKMIAELSDRLSAALEIKPKLEARIDALDLELKSIKKVPSRIEKVDADFATYRTEVMKQILDTTKKINSIEVKIEKQRKDDFESLNKKLLEYQTDVKVVSELKKGLQLRIEEDLRLSQKVDDVDKAQLEFRTVDEDLKRQQRALVSDFALENKRITDIQLETSALRKRIEEERNSIDLQKELIRKIDARLNEFQSTEIERKQSQASFIDKQNLLQVERENTWKEWQKKFTDLESLGRDFDSQLLELSETHRAVKRSQAEFEEINDKFNRRINEITEMNRLSEERFRQEWVAFKADDQKRWTNYTLSHEEEQREDERQFTKIFDRLVALEDLSQEINDMIQMVTEETQKQMHGLLGLTQEMLDSYTQTIAKRPRKFSS